MLHPQEHLSPITLKIATGPRRGEHVTLVFLNGNASMIDPKGQVLGNWTPAQAITDFTFPGLISDRYLFTIHWLNGEMKFHLSRTCRRQLTRWMDCAFLTPQAMATLRLQGWRRVAIGLLGLTLTAAACIALSQLAIRVISTYYVLPFGMLMAEAVLFAKGLDNLLRHHRLNRH